MKTIGWFLASAVLVIVIQTLGLQLTPSFTILVDPGIIVIVFFALAGGPIQAMIVGSVLGLIQDSLTGGLFGLHGFANTVVAFALARLRQQFVLRHLPQVAFAFALAALLQSLVLVCLGFVLAPPSPLPGPSALAGRVVSSVAGGLLAMVLWRRLRVWRSGRRRRNRLKLRMS